MHIAQPETLLRWRREWFRNYWRRKSQGKPKISPETVALIEKMAGENHLWGAQRIRGELLKLGIEVSKRTIQKYMPKERGSRSSSQTWAMRESILRDAMQRDITTARRAALLETLWNERYLTRSQLIARVELRLGKNCFGISAWEDTFYRDMRFVKQAFEAMSFRLLFSRNKQQGGYYLEGQPPLSSEIKQILKGSAAEVDPHQIDIYRKLSYAERFHQGCSISDTARKVVAYRIRQENPRLSVAEANRKALQRVPE